MKHIILSILFITNLTNCRSVHRPVDPEDPKLLVESSKTGLCYPMIDSQLQEYPFFHCFDEEYFKKHMLPDTINYRYEPDKSVSGEVLNELIDNFMTELMNKKRKFKDFTILKCTDFNTRKRSGFIVVKFKDYPFVLKLSIETPKTLTDFSTRGVQERAIFCMASSMRHLAGLTRIRTIEKIKNSLTPDNPWADKLSLPRKWFWMPKEPEYLMITSYNLGGKKEAQTKIPAIYAIICDEVKFSDHRPSNQECIDFCNSLEFILDPHVTNFTYDAITKKITIIDTEYFPILMGIREKFKPSRSYIDWYSRLASRFMQHKFCMLKHHRRARQHQSGSYYDPYK